MFSSSIFRLDQMFFLLSGERENNDQKKRHILFLFRRRRLFTHSHLTSVFIFDCLVNRFSPCHHHHGPTDPCH